LTIQLTHSFSMAEQSVGLPPTPTIEHQNGGSHGEVALPSTMALPSVPQYQQPAPAPAPVAPQLQQAQQQSQQQQPQQQQIQFSWPPSDNGTPAAGVAAVQQALQVNAGSQQTQQGFVLPTVNQLPMPASIGIPGVFPGAAAPNPAPTQALAPPPPMEPTANFQSITPAPPPGTNGMSNNTVAGVKRTAESDALDGPDEKQFKLEPSVVSSYSSEKAPMAALTDAELEKLTPAEKRRYERNMREQQRSYRISQQIKMLRDVLEENKIPFKPNKFSILVSVVEYIKQLQARAIMLDSEHQRLAETIRQTNEMVTSGQVPSSGEESQNEDASRVHKMPDIASSDLMVKGLDYEGVFDRCPSALGIASLDGRVLSCNTSFEELLSVRKDQILQQSMFMYIRNHQDIFEAMADLLKRSSTTAEAADAPKGTQLLFWCGYVVSLQAKKLAFSITLTNTIDGDPKYFSLSAAEMSEQNKA